MTPTSLRFATRDGVSLHALHWQRTGNGPGMPILLLHGLASNCRLWDGAAAHLAGLGHDVIALDLRGHGLSDKPDSGYAVEEVVTDVVDVIDVLSRDNAPWSLPLVVGQSWGGNLVIDLAARHGDKVRGVVAVDGGTIELKKAFPEWHECERTLAPPRLAGMSADRLRSLIRGAHPDWSDTAIDGTMANMRHHPDGTIEPWLTFENHITVLRGLWEHSPTDLFPRIEVPVLFTPAAKVDDEMTRNKRAMLDIARRDIAACRIEWFQPADHDLHAQHPERFAETIHRAHIEGFFP